MSTYEYSRENCLRQGYVEIEALGFPLWVRRPEASALLQFVTTEQSIAMAQKLERQFGVSYRLSDPWVVEDTITIQMPALANYAQLTDFKKTCLDAIAAANPKFVSVPVLGTPIPMTRTSGTAVLVRGDNRILSIFKSAGYELAQATGEKTFSIDMANIPNTRAAKAIAACINRGLPPRERSAA